MKKSRTIILAIIGFVFVVLVIVLLLVSTVGKLTQQNLPRIQSAIKTANAVTATSGDINNVIANVVNNSTNPSLPPGVGATNSQLASVPSQTDVVMLKTAQAAQTISISAGINGNTTVNGMPQGENIPVRIAPSLDNKQGANINIINTTPNGLQAGSLIVTPLAGVAISGLTTINPGFYIRYTANSLNNFIAGLPVRF